MFSSSAIQDLLDDRAYHIEFNGHLSNHAKHAVVALAGLGVPAPKIQAYYNAYARMTTYGSGLEQPKASPHVVTDENWDSLFGRRKSFSAYCDFFDRRERELGLDVVLARYLPRLLPGWVGAFTHAAIHLGWALDAGSRWMAIEGLAYLAFAYVPCHPDRAGTADGRGAGARPIASLIALAAAWEDAGGTLKPAIRSAITGDGGADLHPELARSGLQYRIARVLGEGHPLFYRTPAWVDGWRPGTDWDDLYHAITLLYLARPGDFVLLHLVTSLYAIEQIARRLPPEQERDIVTCFWIGALGVALSGGDFPRRSKLETLDALYRDAVDDGGAAAWHGDWDRIIARAVEEEDEHNPKLVYVLQQRWAKTGGRSIYRLAAGQLTVTPGLPPSFETPPND